MYSVISMNTSGLGISYTGPRGVDDMTKFVRYYPATNTAAKVRSQVISAI